VVAAGVQVGVRPGGLRERVSTPDRDGEAAAWLTSLRDALGDQARRTAVVAVTAQADADPDSAQALIRLTADRRAALNDLLQPSGVQVTPDEYPLLYGPVLARILFERAEATDAFVASVVARWLSGRQ
jgi:hypothetical protein